MARDLTHDTAPEHLAVVPHVSAPVPAALRRREAARRGWDRLGRSPTIPVDATLSLSHDFLDAFGLREGAPPTLRRLQRAASSMGRRLRGRSKKDRGLRL